MTVTVASSRALMTLATSSAGTGGAAQPMTLSLSSGATAGNMLALPGGVAPVATATLASPLSTSGPVTSLPVTALPAAIASGSTLLLVWGGYAQAFTTSAQVNANATSVPVNSATPSFAYPAGTPLADSTVLPYVKFPASIPEQVTGNPGIRFIIHNWSTSCSIWPWLINPDGSLFAGNGGRLVRVEPGNRNLAGSTSWGTINMTVPGTPTAALRLAFQTLQTTDAAGMSVAAFAWMV